MAEIRMERTQSNVMTWLLGLALLALVIIGLVLVAADSAAGADANGVHEVGNPQEGTQEDEKDETPRRLQQWASADPATARAA